MATERIFIGLGSNLGDSRGRLLWALEELERLRTRRGWSLIGVSSLYRSSPWETVGPDFLNAVAVLQGQAEPHAVLAELQALEQAAGRERPYRYAPRTLDADLLLHGSRTVDTPDLCVPHPRALQRAFVLVPLWELAPGLEWPDIGSGWRLHASQVSRDPRQQLQRLSDPGWPTRPLPPVPGPAAG